MVYIVILQMKKKEAFATLERLRKKGTVDNYNDELNTYRDEKYGN